MKILTIDTSTRRNWISLFEDDRMIGCLHFEDRQSCLINLVPGIQHILQNAGMTIQVVDCICTVIGPGAWSSLRIGLATVKQLCLTNDIALRTISSSQVLADYASLIGVAAPALLTAIDAGGGKVYSAMFQHHKGDYQQSGADTWYSAGEAVAAIEGDQEMAILGDGAVQFEANRKANWQLFHQSPQTDSRYLQLLVRHALANPPLEHSAIQLLKPLYVQPSSAELEFNVRVS
jgi:tRNA threonylcarbamoyladenosine biosynthesis protein TsaB